VWYPLTEQQERILAIVRPLAETFSQRAAEHDRAGDFPFENFAELRAAGLPALIVPEKYGGWGGTLLDTVLAMEALAEGDGSTALSLTMHMQMLGNIEETRSWPESLLAEVCKAAVERGALLNALASEPELGSPSRGGKPKTTARPVYAPGAEAGAPPIAWILEGRKNFASMSPVLDYMLILATLEDGSEQSTFFVVPPGEGVEIVETWDAMGMRSTGSHDVALHDVYVPDCYRVPSKPELDGAPKINAWFALTVSAIYVGVAAAALTTAARYAQERIPTALGKPIAELESIQRRLGQAELLLHQARTHLYHTADLWVRYPARRGEIGPSVTAAKYVATNNAIEIVDHCMRVIGGASMSKALPIERYYRDVRGGLSHPMNDDQALVFLGKHALNRIHR
jgi:alkylation response protein AidB-like acyl-CoA dehydrogenase